MISLATAIYVSGVNRAATIGGDDTPDLAPLIGKHIHLATKEGPQPHFPQIPLRKATSAIAQNQRPRINQGINALSHLKRAHGLIIVTHAYANIKTPNAPRLYNKRCGRDQYHQQRSLNLSPHSKQSVQHAHHCQSLHRNSKAANFCTNQLNRQTPNRPSPFPPGHRRS